MAIHPRTTASIENSDPMAGRAIFIDEAMNGGRNEVRVAMTRAQSRSVESEQNGIDRLILNAIN